MFLGSEWRYGMKNRHYWYLTVNSDGGVDKDMNSIGYYCVKYEHTIYKHTRMLTFALTSLSHTHTHANTICVNLLEIHILYDKLTVNRSTYSPKARIHAKLQRSNIKKH